ncbi:MAG: hypothetical protein OHK0017_04270 [Patescibacteria group bacterium]
MPINDQPSTGRSISFSTISEGSDFTPYNTLTAILSFNFSDSVSEKDYVRDYKFVFFELEKLLHSEKYSHLLGQICNYNNDQIALVFPDLSKNSKYPNAIVRQTFEAASLVKDLEQRIGNNKIGLVMGLTPMYSFTTQIMEESRLAGISPRLSTLFRLTELTKKEIVTQSPYKDKISGKYVTVAMPGQSINQNPEIILNRKLALALSTRLGDNFKEFFDLTSENNKFYYTKVRGLTDRKILNFDPTQAEQALRIMHLNYTELFQMFHSVYDSELKLPPLSEISGHFPIINPNDERFKGEFQHSSDESLDETYTSPEPNSNKPEQQYVEVQIDYSGSLALLADPKLSQEQSINSFTNIKDHVEQQLNQTDKEFGGQLSLFKKGVRITRFTGDGFILSFPSNFRGGEGMSPIEILRSVTKILNKSILPVLASVENKSDYDYNVRILIDSGHPTRFELSSFGPVEIGEVYRNLSVIERESKYALENPSVNKLLGIVSFGNNFIASLNPREMMELRGKIELGKVSDLQNRRILHSLKDTFGVNGPDSEYNFQPGDFRFGYFSTLSNLAYLLPEDQREQFRSNLEATFLPDPKIIEERRNTLRQEQQERASKIGHELRKMNK